MIQTSDETLVARSIRVTTDAALPAELLKTLCASVRSSAPPGVLTTVMVNDATGSPRAVCLIHKDGPRHVYSLPLTRALTTGEVETIARALADALDTNFDLEATEVGFAEPPPAANVEIDQDQYVDLCAAWAKSKHEMWMQERLDAGWRYGPTVSLSDRTHPLLRPWMELPDEFRKPDLDQPKMLVDLMRRQGYALIRQDDLAALDRLMKSVA